MSFTECCNLRFIGDNHSPIQPDGYCLHCGFHPEIEKLKEENNELKNKLDNKRVYIKQLKDKNLSLTHQLEIQTKRVENLKKSNEFYADRELYENGSGNSSFYCEFGEVIENESYPIFEDCGELARVIRVIDQELEKELEGVK